MNEYPTTETLDRLHDELAGEGGDGAPVVL